MGVTFGEGFLVIIEVVVELVATESCIISSHKYLLYYSHFYAARSKPISVYELMANPCDNDKISSDAAS